ncbi:MAG: hypothetical protein HOO99_14095 [Hyphomicrobiaceae bacterium]|nr:hypothetical protein [Hyphomicrobiaceae bacterium]
MTDTEHELVLLAGLRQAFDANCGASCSAHGDRPAGVLVLWEGHLRGIWFRRDGAFHFIPGGYVNPTYASTTVAEAVVYTLSGICRAK